MNIVSSALGKTADAAGYGDEFAGAQNYGSKMMAGFNRKDTASDLGQFSTALGMLSQINAGNSKARALRLQAGDDALQGNQAQVAGSAAVGGLREQLMNTLSQKNSAYGASGVDLGSGVAADTRYAVTRANDDASAVTGYSADIRQRRSQIDMFNHLAQAKNAQDAGVLGAVGSGLSSIIRAFAAG